MPRRLPAGFMVLTVLFLNAVGCSTSTKPPDTILLTSTESDEMAMWLADSLLPPQAMSARIYSELNAIRSRFSDEVPQAGAIPFRLPWQRNRLLCSVEEESYNSMAAGNYGAWDSINIVYGVSRVTLRKSGFSFVAYLDFGGTINPEHMLVPYVALPGMKSVCPNFYSGDWSNVYAEIEPVRSTYVFMHGDGDCPLGCTDNNYWYFTVEGNVANYLGTFHEGWPAEPEPSWWEEAVRLRRQYQRPVRCQSSDASNNRR